MAKYYGHVGFRESVEVRPGVYDVAIKEIPYFGDVLQSFRRLRDLENVNPTLHIGNRISVLSDAYFNTHVNDILYITWAGARWTVNAVEVKPPRIIMSMGEAYNGPTPTAPDDSGEPEPEG